MAINPTERSANYRRRPQTLVGGTALQRWRWMVVYSIPLSSPAPWLLSSSIWWVVVEEVLLLSLHLIDMYTQSHSPISRLWDFFSDTMRWDIKLERRVDGGEREEAQSVKGEKKSSADVPESVLGSISSFQRPFSSPGGLWRIPHDPG